MKPRHGLLAAFTLSFALASLHLQRVAAHEEDEAACEISVDAGAPPVQFEGCVNLKFVPAASRSVIQLFYSAESDTASFAVRSDAETGYLALGFSQDGEMVPGVTVVAYVAEEKSDGIEVGDAVVSVYNMTDRSEAGVGVVDDAEGFLGFGSIKAIVDDDSGLLTMSFTRPLDNGFTSRLEPGKDNILLWARGPNPGADGPKRIQRHFAHAATSVFAMLPGSRSDIEDRHEHNHGRSRIYLAHGLALSLAWLLVAPAGVMVAQFSERGNVLEPNQKWLRTHRAMQISATALTTVAWIFGLAYSTDRQFAHLLVGSVVLGFSLLQVGGAFLRPGPTAWDRPAWKVFHGTIGRLALALAWINILLGLRLYNARKTYIIVAAVLMAAYIITFVILTANKRRKQKITNASGSLDPFQEG